MKNMDPYTKDYDALVKEMQDGPILCDIEMFISGTRKQKAWSVLTYFMQQNKRRIYGLTDWKGFQIFVTNMHDFKSLCLKYNLRYKVR